MAAGIITPVYFGMTEEGVFGRLPVAPVYVHQDYPAMRFKDGEVMTVKDEAEDKALGEGWSDRPDGPRQGPPADEMAEFRKWKEAQAQASAKVEEVTNPVIKRKPGRQVGYKVRPKGDPEAA